MIDLQKIKDDYYAVQHISGVQALERMSVAYEHIPVLINHIESDHKVDVINNKMRDTLKYLADIPAIKYNTDLHGMVKRALDE